MASEIRLRLNGMKIFSERRRFEHRGMLVDELVLVVQERPLRLSFCWALHPFEREVVNGLTNTVVECITLVDPKMADIQVKDIDPKMLGGARRKVEMGFDKVWGLDKAEGVWNFTKGNT